MVLRTSFSSYWLSDYIFMLGPLPFHRGSFLVLLCLKLVMLYRQRNKAYSSFAHVLIPAVVDCSFKSLTGADVHNLNKAATMYILVVPFLMFDSLIFCFVPPQL